MNTFLFSSCFLFLLFYPAVPICLPADFTLYVEKPECDYCVAINTTICMGYCYSRDSNLKGSLRSRFLVQQRCTYEKVDYRSVILPGCPFDSNPIYTYPVALSCHCGGCRTDSNDCTHRASRDGARCTKPVTNIHLHAGLSNYITPF